ENGVVAGVPLALEAFRLLDPKVSIRVDCEDGSRVKKGEPVLFVTGHARGLLSAERVALNYMQRLSGIATLTRAYVDAIPSGASTRITDTRKTTPGLRALERYAVRCGGGHNHREDLSSAVLIKDNHIAASGGIEQAIARARERAPHTSRIECEVESMSELDQALAAGADVVLLDNFADSDLDAAVARVAGRALIEVSGRVSLERVTKIAKAGVSVISVGALTHSARAVDLGLDWEAGA
ncbi:MAG TPA: carboxylating nicotinate-nucleotide diphosphorylase, partial [Polyangiales bacterium]|nr:carboxylating nicotinate-nucleotide diphosphorylase [Polyangiales bacterium]